jgi:hypothetical protein
MSRAKEISNYVAVTSPKKITDQLRDIVDLRVRYSIVGRTATVRQKNGLLLLKAIAQLPNCPIAQLHGGACLASEFTKTVGPRYRLRCGNGHEWDADLRQLFRGRWCGACARLSHRPTIENMQALAEKRGGQCLSSEYVNAHTHLQWQCATGHQWLATPGKISSGKWCPKCRGYMPVEERLALLAGLAQERGGQLLSTTYHSSHGLLQ